MRRYRVVFTDESNQDIASSFEWGRREWGSAAAQRWYRELRSHTRKILMQFPKSQPLAPESEKAGREIRHVIFGRYRILFEIVDQTVRVLHVRGAYTGDPNDDIGIRE